MILIPCRQGTPEWLAARAGKITASMASVAISMVGSLNDQQAKYVNAIKDGMQPADAAVAAGYRAPPTSTTVARVLRGEDPQEPSDAALKYLTDVAIERISGRPRGEPPKGWVLDRGHEMEDVAKRAYSARTGYFLASPGLAVTDDGIFGYSTDGAVRGQRGGVECKAPIDSRKLLSMWETGDVSEYVHQMQFGMWVMNWDWIDFIMFDPDLESIGKSLYVKRIHRDDDFIHEMVIELARADKLAQEIECKFRASNSTEKQKVQTTVPTEAV